MSYCPYLFLYIIVELWAVAIRHNVKIKGITQNLWKINQFVDETVSIIADEDESSADAVKASAHFKQISVLGMNKN